MFGLEWQEIILILALLLLVFGPEKLPEIARELGKIWREFSKAASNVTEAVQSPPPVKGAESEENKAVMGIARKLNINTEGKSIMEIAQEIATRIEKKEE